MTILVAGGSRGIGRAIVERCVADGSDVVFTYFSAAQEAAHVEQECGGKAQAIQLDGTDPVAVEAFMRSADCPKDLSAAVISQGINEDKLVKDVRWDDFERILRQNVAPAVNFTAALLPALIRRRGGHLLYMSSQGRIHARNGNVAYGASKAALTRYAANVTLENARFGIQANVIEPGFVATDLTMASVGEDGLRSIRKDTPTKTLTTPQDVADTVSMVLLSAPVMNGAILPVCGGIQVC